MANGDIQKCTLSLLMDNKPGVLSRIVGLFSGRGFNIESLCVAATNDSDVSRLTLVTKGDRNVIEQVKKQLNKLIDIIKVLDFQDSPNVQREMALIKVRAKGDHKAEILRLVAIFNAKVVDVSQDYYTIAVTGGADKIQDILELLKPAGIKEIARTGAIALGREKK